MIAKVFQVYLQTVTKKSAYRICDWVFFVITSVDSHTCFIETCIIIYIYWLGFTSALCMQ